MSFVPKRNALWWCKCIIHNMIVHPLLPLADALERTRFNTVSQRLYKWHETSVPPGY